MTYSFNYFNMFHLASTPPEVILSDLYVRVNLALSSAVQVYPVRNSHPPLPPPPHFISMVRSAMGGTSAPCGLPDKPLPQVCSG